MLITKAHLLVLQELANGEAAGHAVRTLAEDEPQEHIYRGLELQGLLLLEVPRAYRLTDTGREALGILEAMRKAAGQAQGPYNLKSLRTTGAFLAPICPRIVQRGCGRASR